MVLQGMRFEVSWQSRKADVVRKKQIELGEAARVLNDPRVKLEYQAEPPHLGQYRAIGLSPDGRLLTVAVSIVYPDESENSDDVGMIQVYTSWVASNAERALCYE